VQSIVNDNGDLPTMLGLPFHEASAMDASNAVSGHKNLLLGDFSNMIIVERVPSIMITDPLIMDQATARPTGQIGWYSYSRVGSDITTPAAAYGSNAFVFHTT
jgi:HK97 family phage major capsid protein